MEVEKHVIKEEQWKYFEALKSAEKINFKTLKFSLQPNFYDCGVFTCLFGTLIALQEGLRRTVAWGTEGNSIDELRQFIQEDIRKENHSFLDNLIKMLEKNRVI
jgi:Ulp1 family protease